MYRQKQARIRVQKPQTLDESYERAKEARVHRARHTFVAPETLMHLIVVNRDFLRIRGIVEKHWKLAQKEQGEGYSERDLWLWTQVLGWNERQDE